VYKLALKGQNKTVAIKWTRADRADEDREMLVEIRILSTLRHKNIVNFLGIILMDEKIGIVEEHYSTDLSNLMSSLTYELKVLALRHIANGMLYLHSLDPSIIHRDLKPSNVLAQLDPALFVIADFGLSRMLDQSKLTARTGTPGYMAPEMERSESEQDLRKMAKYSTKVDIYSFGILGAELFMGRHPLYSEDGHFDTQKVFNLEEKKERIRIPGMYPKELEELFKKCVEDDPMTRPSFKNILTVLESLPESVDEDNSTHVIN